MADTKAPTEIQQLLVEARVTNERKSIGVAYFLFLLFFPLGVPDFYVGRMKLGFVILGCSVATALLYAFSFMSLLTGGDAILTLPLISVLGAVLACAWLFDLFTLPRAIRKDTQLLRERFFLQYGYTLPAGVANIPIPATGVPSMSDLATEPVNAVKKEIEVRKEQTPPTA